MSYFIDLYNNLFHKKKLEYVFTPGIVARTNYLPRKELEKRIFKSLKTPGIQIVLYGHSGSGKTTVVRRILDRNGFSYIRTQCTQDKTFNDIILDAFSQLNIFCKSEESQKEVRKLSSSLKADIASINADITNGIEYGSEQKFIRLLPPRLTSQKLAEIFRETGQIWMIEDFHKLRDEEKQKLADVMKVFIDEANEPSVNQISKIVCIGAVNSPRELITLDPNLSSRIDQIKVPLLSDDEIQRIIVQGCKLLNVEMSSKLIDNLVSYSNNIGSLAHAMCLDICNEYNIRMTSFKRVYVEDASFNIAIKGYLNRNSDTLQKTYDLITSKNKAAWYILKSLNVHNKESIAYSELICRINPKNQQISEEDIKFALTELQGQPYYIIRYDDEKNKYSFSTPFWSAFIRIQLETEQAEKNKKKKNRKNALLLNEESFDAMTFKQILDKLYQDQIRLLELAHNNN